MANIFGTEQSKRDILGKIGNMTQITSFDRCVMGQGKASGTKVINVNNGGGLSFCILEDKALDIYKFCYKGTNLSFVSKPGLVSPTFYDTAGSEFLRTFQGGFLYTCGLMNVGGPCRDGGADYPFHGRIANTPAENVSLDAYWDGDEYIMRVSGEVRQAALFSENLVLRREIKTSLGSDAVTISDMVENQGFEEKQVMILYHMNMGYPLLDADTKIYIPVVRSESRGGNDVQVPGNYAVFCAPEDEKAEQVIYHYLKGDKNGMTAVIIYNHRTDTGIAFEYDISQLPFLTQWKSMKTGDYALGIEPGNCHPEGRAETRKRKEDRYLGPGESSRYEIKIKVISGLTSLKDIAGVYDIRI